MSSAGHHPQFLGHQVIDPSGDVVGTIEDVVFDRHSGAPKWAVVNPGALHRSHYVPLTGAQHNDDGDVAVPYSKDLIGHAPPASREHVLSEEDEQALEDHYAGGAATR